MKKLILAAALVLTGAVCLYGEIIEWKAVTQNAESGTRELFGFTQHNSAFYIIGGNNGSALRDIWKSYNGITWTQIAPTGQTDIGFGGSFQAIDFLNEMYVIGGDVKLYKYSSDVTSVAEITGYPTITEMSNENRLIVFDNKLWSIYGKCISNSTNGSDWTVLTRNALNYTKNIILSFGEKLWSISGIYDNSDYTNHVLSSTNGIDWDVVTLNAEFSVRSAAVGWAYADKMWIAGGNIGSPATVYNDVWYSTDGIKWIRDTEHATWSKRYDGRAIVLSDGRPVIAMGYDNTSIYYKDIWVGLLSASTSTPTITPTTYITRTWTSTKSCTPTRTPSLTRTQTATPTFTASSTRTVTPTRTVTSTSTVTGTNTEVATKTVTNTVTESHTVTATVTETYTATETWTITETVTHTPTFTSTLTPTPIETIMIWYNSTDKDWHGTDVRLSWRQYPDTVDNPVVYTLYYENISDSRIYPVVLIVPNADDINPAAQVFTYDVQGLVAEDMYSFTITAVGGDFGVSYMSENNVTVKPKESPTPVRP